MLSQNYTITAEEIKVLKKQEALEIKEKGMIERYRGNHQEALNGFDTLIMELAESDEKWAKLMIGEAMHQLGVTLQNIGKDYKAALSCIWCAIAYRQAIRDSFGLAYSYFQIPMCRLASGEKFADVMPDIIKARRAIVIAISLARRKDNFKVLGDMYHNLAYIYQVEEDCNNALVTYGEALDYRRISQDERGTGLTLVRLAECYQKIGNGKCAKSSAEEALKIFQKIGDMSRVYQVKKIMREIDQDK